MGAVKALVLCVGVLLAWPTMSQQAQVGPPRGQASAAAGVREQLNIVSTTQDAEVAGLLADGFRLALVRLFLVEVLLGAVDLAKVLFRVLHEMLLDDSLHQSLCQLWTFSCSSR